MAQEPEVQEIVRLSIKKMTHGVVFCREFAFFANNEVYTRVTNMDTGESPRGWQACVGWEDLDQIKILALRMAAKGWTAIWNPNYTAMGLAPSASFS